MLEAATSGHRKLFLTGPPPLVPMLRPDLIGRPGRGAEFASFGAGSAAHSLSRSFVMARVRRRLRPFLNKSRLNLWKHSAFAEVPMRPCEVSPISLKINRT